MDAADSKRVPKADLELIRRLVIVVVLGFVFVAGFARLTLLYTHKFHDATGQAQWIWAPIQFSRGEPVAFFLTREFDLPPNRRFAHIKLLGDPQYTLWFNGQEIASRRIGEARQLDVYDVSSLARDRKNRLVVALRSTNGVGGFIAGIDIAPELENYIVTDEQWRVYRRWRSDLIAGDPRDATWTPPLVVGDPPYGRWNYLHDAAGRPPVPTLSIASAIDAFRFKAMRPTTKVRSGVAVRVAEPVRATAYDFGRIVDARLRLTIGWDNGSSRVVHVRTANAREELFTLEGNQIPFVFAAGERTVIDPDVRYFRYALVYGGQATPEALVAR